MATRVIYIDADGLPQRVAEPVRLGPPAGLGAPPVTVDRLTGITGEALAPQVWKLFPRGRAFGRDGARLSDPDPARVYWGSLRWHGMARMIGEVMARIHAALNRALYGAFPTVCAPDLIEDWEREHGLPDPCFAVVTNDAARRLAILDARTPAEGANRLEIEQWLARFGLTTLIDEPNGFEFGLDGFGEGGFGSADLPHLFTYSGDIGETIWIEFGGNGFGDTGFGETADTALHCAIAKVRPSHTLPVYTST